MSSHRIEGYLLDAFNLAFHHDKWAIDPRPIVNRIGEELEDRLYVCRKLNKTYVVHVLITELEGDRNAISQRKEGEIEEGFLRKRQA